MRAARDAPAAAFACWVSIPCADALSSHRLVAWRDLFEALVGSPVVPVAGMFNLNAQVPALIAACFESMTVDAHGTMLLLGRARSLGIRGQTLPVILNSWHEDKGQRNAQTLMMRLPRSG